VLPFNIILALFYAVLSSAMLFLLKKTFKNKKENIDESE
jgi:hypothetical protein